MRVDVHAFARRVLRGRVASTASRWRHHPHASDAKLVRHCAIMGQKQKVQLFGAGAKGWNCASANGTAKFMCLLVPKLGPPMVATER